MKAFQKAYGRYPAVGAVYDSLAARYIANAYKKAGSAKTEKFIDALEGMTVDSPLGPVTMRAFDHQAMLPMFMGVTQKVGGYDFLLAGDIMVIPGEKAMPTVEEIKRTR